MTIEEAIKHCEEVAEYKEVVCRTMENEEGEFTDSGNTYYKYCKRCAKEHRQFAEWLKALKEIWDSGDCNDCGNRGCLYKPKVGHLVRYNCPFYRKEVKADEREQ